MKIQFVQLDIAQQQSLNELNRTHYDHRGTYLIRTLSVQLWLM